MYFDKTGAERGCGSFAKVNLPDDVKVDQNI
jgi:hypothetical protein